MEFNKKELLILKVLGFNKKYLSDKSGWWFQKKFNHKGLKFRIYIEHDRDILTLSIKTGNWTNGSIKFHKYYDDVASYKCNIKSVKLILKTYKEDAK